MRFSHNARREVERGNGALAVIASTSHASLNVRLALADPPVF